MAVAITGLAEVALSRIAAPLLTHTPAGGAGGPTLTSAVTLSGDLATGAASLLAPLTVLALAAVVWRRSRAEAVLLTGAVATTMVAIATPGVAFVGHAAVIAAAAWLVGTALRSLPPLHGVGVALLGCAFVAGLLPLFLEGASGLTGSIPIGTTSSARTVAEAALVGAPVAFAASVVRHPGVTQLAWKPAAATGISLVFAFAFAPGYLAITTMWASGITLSLPPVAYVFAGAFLGLVVPHWLADRQTRHLAAGIALVAVAGIMPGVVHHNLTALAGLALLTIAAPTAVPVRPAVPVGGVHG